MVLPLEQIARVKRIRSQFEHATKLPRRTRRPEAKLLHQTGTFRGDQTLKLAVELREFGMVLYGMERGVVAGVALILPDVDERVAVADFRAPGADEMDLKLPSALFSHASDLKAKTYLVLRHTSHARVP